VRRGGAPERSRPVKFARGIHLSNADHFPNCQRKYYFTSWSHWLQDFSSP
jgi:hypothetical protein